MLTISIAVTATPTLTFIKRGPYPVVQVSESVHAGVDHHVMVCGVLPMGLGNIEAAYLRHAKVFGNAPVELGILPQDLIPPPVGFDVFVYRPHFTLRRVQTGTITTDLHTTDRQLSTTERARFHVTETDLMPVTARVTNTTLTMCRNLVVTTAIRLLQEGSASFEICATWAQPIWDTKCISVQALQIAWEGSHLDVGFPWQTTLKSFPLPSFTPYVWVDRRAGPAGLSAPALAAGAVRLILNFEVVTVEVATAFFTNHTQNPENYTETYTEQRETVTGVVKQVPLSCTPMALIDLSAFHSLPAATVQVIRHRCDASVNLTTDLTPPTMTEANALTLFNSSTVLSQLVNVTLDTATREISTVQASIVVCALDATGVDVCDTPRPFELHNTTQRGFRHADDGPVVTRRTPDLHPSLVDRRVIDEDPLVSIRAGRHAVRGQSLFALPEGTNAEHPTLFLYDQTGSLLASCETVSAHDDVGTRSARRPVYHIGFGREQRPFPLEQRRLCADLDLVTFWGQTLSVVEERQAGHELGPWPVAPALTTALTLFPDTSTSAEFQVVTVARPRFVVAREAVGIQCVSALPPTTWSYTVNNVTRSRTVERVLSASLVQTRSNVTVANLTIVNVTERATPNNGRLLFYTIVIPALAPSAVYNARCVVPTNFGQHGFADSPGSNHADSRAVCDDMQVVFMFAKGEQARMTDTVRVTLPIFAEHEQDEGIAHKTVHAFAESNASVQVGRRLFASASDVVFSTTFRTVPPSIDTLDQVTLSENQPITMDCATGHVAAVYSHELHGTGKNELDVRVPRNALPLNGTLACSLTIPRLGLTTAHTLQSVGLRQFKFFTQTAGAIFTPTVHAYSVFVNVTFHANGIPPVSPVPVALTAAQLAEHTTAWGNNSHIAIYAIAVFMGVFAPIVIGCVVTQ
jgi:hypothetical protein